MSTGVDELADGRRVGEHGVGRRDGVDQDFRDQVCARLVDVVEAGLVDQAVDRLAPRQIGLQQAAVQRTLLPGRVRKPLVARLRRAFGLSGDDGAEFADEGKPLFGCDLWLVHYRLEQNAGAFDEILALDADERIERQRVSGGRFR